MRIIFAIVALFAVLGGFGGAGLHAGHAFDSGQLVADGDNGSGG